MSDFLKEYKSWDSKNTKGKKDILLSCASFYEEKAIDYILANFPKKKQKEFKKDPIIVEFTPNLVNGKEVSFGDNIVFVLEELIETGDKKNIFFQVARNTICAVFVNLFYNTASDPKKKTRFGSIANGFFATITTEFAKGKEFENDMMQAYAEVLGEVMDMGPAIEQ